MRKTRLVLTIGLCSALIAGTGFANDPQEGCVQSINVSTGYDQSTSQLIGDGDPDDDWILTQHPAGSPAVLGQPGYIFPKLNVYDWAGSTSKWMNFHASNDGQYNWCKDDLPWVYQNPFCVCGEGEEPVSVTFDLNVHCDNWAEVWLMDGSGNPLQMLLSQIHQEVSSNFTNPPSPVNQTINLLPGQYSLALVQRNKHSVTGVTLDGTISTQEGESVMKCEFSPTLAVVMDGPEGKCDPGGSGEPGDGCPETLNVSTGYNEVSGALISNYQHDDDWILTQLPSGATGVIGQPGYVIPTDAAYDLAGGTSKYLNYHSGTSGVINWYNHDLPIIYQNGFCLCGDFAEEVEVTFDLSLNADNWGEVWLMDDSGNPIQLLLTQPHLATSANFQNPANTASPTVVLQPGQYSLALLQRNAGNITGVNLDAEISVSPHGLLDGDICDFVPFLEENFAGSEVTVEGGGEVNPGFEKKGDGNVQSQKEETQIAVFPNPARDVVEISGIPGGHKVVITSISGRMVLTQKYSKSNGIDVSGLSPGVYILKITGSGNNDEFIEKLIIE
ncbi:MAG: T9SS type A sorting domain-containing protein [Salibacteraceae bacterium]